VNYKKCDHSGLKGMTRCKDRNAPNCYISCRVKISLFSAMFEVWWRWW